MSVSMENMDIDNKEYLYGDNDNDDSHFDLPLSQNDDHVEIDPSPNQISKTVVAKSDPVVVINYPVGCAVKYGVCKNRWEILIDENERRWGGFADHKEWELARWLLKSNASQKDINDFAKLPIVSIQAD